MGRHRAVLAGPAVVLAVAVASCTSAPDETRPDAAGSQTTAQAQPDTADSTGAAPESAGAAAETAARPPLCVDLEITLGRDGAWHGYAQTIKIRNVGASVCLLRHRDLRVAVQDRADETWTEARPPVSRMSPVVLRPGQSARLMVVSPSECASRRPPATRIRVDVVKVAEASVELAGAWLPMQCKGPEIVSLTRVPGAG